MDKRKYRVLRVMMVVFKLVAWLSLIVSLIASVTFLIQFSLMSQQLGTSVPAFAGFTLFIAFVANGFFVFGSLLAISELIRLVFDIEKQTRATRDKVTEVRQAA